MTVTPITASEVADPAALNSRLAQIEANITGGAVGASVGMMLFYAGSSAPTGWLLCDGSAVSRATYAALFTKIGTTFGAGDGSSTFNVPDMRGRTGIGAGTGSGLTARTLGQQIGEENHQLTVPELPAHTHPLGGVSLSTGLGTLATNQNIADGTSASAGSDTPHNNMQPSLVLSAIIKT